MKSSVKLCNIEGCNNPIWSNKLCKIHVPKKPLKMSKGIYYQIREKGKHGVWESSKKIKEMHLFFKNIWNKRPHKSEVSEKFLGNEISNLYFHHILAKSKYPQAMFDEENIILLSGDEHATVELNSTKYEEINKRREQLKIKYNIL